MSGFQHRLFVLTLLLLGLGANALSAEPFFSPVRAQAVPVEFDVTITLHNNPTTVAERAPYEAIIGYFADAVFEASNGAHKIGTVTIFANFANSDQADILWLPDCHPRAHVSGRGALGLRITMCDEFDGTDFLANDLGHQGGGYTIGHEWGHYSHSMYDEYKGSPEYDIYFDFPHSNDEAVPNSIMNYHWDARGGNFEWLNYSTPNNDTGKTAQSRVYDASGWETLGRPLADDPRDGQRLALSKRIFYAELGDVAPGEGENPAIDLPDAMARSGLEIIWSSGEVTFQIIIDRSGSMAVENKMENAKTAAKLLVDLAEIDNSTIGVISFSSSATVVQPLTAIDSQGTKDAIKTQIDTINAGGNTAIGDALQKALDDFMTFGGEDTSRVALLLTNGQSNTGSNPLNVLPGYKGANIPIFTFAYGSDANQVILRQLANGTGGDFNFSPIALAELIPIFESANQAASPSVSISSNSMTVPSLATSSFPIQVDSTLDQLNVVVTYPGPIAGIDLTLMDPSSIDAGSPDCTFSGTATLCLLRIGSPDPGTWHLTATSTALDVNVKVRASGFPADIITYTASVTSLMGDVVQYPEPIVLLAILAKEAPISGARVTATVETPGGIVESVSMRDDGVAPDADADDGLYSAIFDYDQNGAYNITVQFNNDAGTAQLTQASLQPSIGEDGQPFPLPPPIPVTENFERSATIQVNVDNFQSDDHGDIPQDATPLPDNNTDIPGRIDFQGDVDVFVVTTSITGDLGLRISNLALGMDPRLRVLASDRTTVLADVDLTTNSSKNGYLSLPISLNAGDIIYAEVSHQGSGSGLYEISAGVPISSDIPSVLAPRDVKQGAIGKLSPYVGESKRFEKAIKNVEKSLDPKLWAAIPAADGAVIDPVHLDPKYGKKVFDYERYAVKELMDLLKGFTDDRCGGVSAIALEYTGPGTITIEAFLKNMSLGIFTVSTEAPDIESTFEIFATEETGGKLNPEIRLVVVGKNVAKINTSCSKPIDIGDVYGNFIIDDLEKLPPKNSGRQVSQEAREAAQTAIDDLVTADRLLAQVVLDEAAGLAAVNPARQAKVDEELKKAEDELAKGDADRDALKPDKAIQRYRKAWEHAQHAVEEAEKQ